MAHTKHIGRYNNERVVIVYCYIPDAKGNPDKENGHMALVVHPDKLPTNIHQSVMNILVSFEAQASNVQHLGEILRKHELDNGTNVLQALHMNGWLKKIATAHIILTPDPNNPNVGHRLDEINKLVEAQKVGDDAAQELKDIDDQAGLYDPAKKQPRSQAPTKTTSADVMGESIPVVPTEAAKEFVEAAAAAAEEISVTESVPEVETDTVDDAVDLEDNDALAKSQLAKARKLRMDADIMIAQAKAMSSQAYELAPELKPDAKRGRPSKSLQA